MLTSPCTLFILFPWSCLLVYESDWLTRGLARDVMHILWPLQYCVFTSVVVVDYKLCACGVVLAIVY